MAIKNHHAVIQLKLLGFPLVNIRKSFHKLTGITHEEMARNVGTSRANLTNHIDGRRHNSEIQQKIADVYEVPVNELFK